MKIIFIRHGEPNYEIDSLTEKGWREAELLPFLHEPLRLRFEYSDADIFSLCVAAAEA